MASGAFSTDLRDRRVLVVEDEFFIAEEIASALEDHRAIPRLERRFDVDRLVEAVAKACGRA